MRFFNFLSIFFYFFIIGIISILMNIKNILILKDKNIKESFWKIEKKKIIKN